MSRDRDRPPEPFRFWLAIAAVFALLFVLSLLVGCVGIVDDYAKTALTFSGTASANTSENLRKKHDIEVAAYAAIYCGQPRIGAVERRYKDPAVLMMRLRMCEAENAIGFTP